VVHMYKDQNLSKEMIKLRLPIERREGELLPEQDRFLDNLFRQYTYELWRYAISYLKDLSRAEKIVQDTFQTAFMHD